MVLSLVVKMRHVILIVTILIGIASLAFGQIYKWVDEKGSVHFTDDFRKIPAEHRTEAEYRKVLEENSPSSPQAKPMPPAESKAPEPKGAEVNVIRRLGNYLTEVVLNERIRRHFVVDTGASFTLISRQTANELGIVIDENTPFVPMGGVGGHILAHLVVLESLRVGKAVAENVEAVVYYRTSSRSDQGKPELLGNTFFNRFRIDLDSVSGKMTLFSLKGSPSHDRPGGYDRDYWVGRFRFYHENLALCKWWKERYESHRTSSAVNKVKQAIRFYEDQLGELERRASLAGVPTNWRR